MAKRKSTADAEPLSGVGVFVEPRYVWVFQCSTRLGLHAATLDRSARNLPKNVCRSGKWIVNGQPIVGPQNAPMAGIDVEALIAGIEAEGYNLWNAEAEPLPDDMRLMR